MMTFRADQLAHVDLRATFSERSRPLIVWIGSGLSAGAGLPTWAMLKEHLVARLRSEAENLDPGGRDRKLQAADIAEGEENSWVSFEILKRELGRASYRDAIRSQLTPDSRTEVPEAYRLLWRLRPAGILNLNLDDLADSAFSAERPGSNPMRFDGRSIGRLPYAIHDPKPFLANLHGVLDDYSSWVMTKSELRQSLANEGYTDFLKTCLSTTTVLLVGITADDIAVGGHIERLASLDLEVGSHYWLTDRRDYDTDHWARGVGLRTITYNNDDGTHSGVIEFVQDLLEYVPPDDLDSRDPVLVEPSDTKGTADVLPEEGVMLSWKADKARSALNLHASRLLKDPGESAYEAYMAFCDEYDEVIHHAWYTSTTPGRNVILGYELLEEAKQGAFGRVYRATDPEGNQVAVKVLHPEIRKNPASIQSFRRGVRSMQILAERGVEGMVRYLEASEIPAFVAMEWVNGPNLAEAREARQIIDWDTLLLVLTQLAAVLRDSHALPERILHRDLRPPNIMLKDWWTDPDGWQLVLLDFDLSWHIGALEKSVAYSTAIGYLAPEQTQNVQGVSTRNAAVDSFGFGMTCYFMVSGNDPVPQQHRHDGWSQSIFEACQSFATTEWKSVPQRFARLIEWCTHDRQASRWDMSMIEAEVARLKDALLYPERVASAELTAEEIAARAESLRGYTWNADVPSASRRTPSGLRMEVCADEPTAVVEVQIEWVRTGVEERANITRYLPAAFEQAQASLRRSSWNVVTTDLNTDWFFVSARVPVSVAARDLDKLAGGLDAAGEALDVLMR